MNSEKPTLYSYWRSSCSWRVRIALNLKGIDYNYKAVNIMSDEAMNDPEFLAVNPARKVPALIANGKPITESLAIIEYIDEAYQNGPALLPKDLVKRAQARAIALQIVAGIQPVMNMRVTKYLSAEEDGKGAKWANYWMNDGLRDLEALVARSAGKYAVGDEVSVADLCIPSILYNAKRLNVDLSQFPILVRIDTELAKIPAFKQAEPEFQPDADLNHFNNV